MDLRRRSAGSCALVALLLAVACSSPTETPRLTDITLSATTLALDAIGATQVVIATPRDAEGRAIRGIQVAWTTSAPGIVSVTSGGLVTGLAVGSARLTASAGGITVPLDVTVQQVPVAPQVVSGADQVASVLQQLPAPVVVRVVDRLGNAIAGRTVTFAVVSGGGSVGTPTATSSATGLATSTWTLGPSTTVVQRLSVSVEGANDGRDVAATATAGAPASYAAAPTAMVTGQTARVGTAVERRPAVVVRDELGNGVGGAAVTFTVLSGGGTVTGATVTTNSLGVATVGGWVLGPTVGENVLRAAVAGFAPVDFTARAVADLCVADGASLISVGVAYASTIATTDCRETSGKLVNYDLYRLDLPATTGVVIEMDGTLPVDAYLVLYDFDTLEPLAENDDIVLGVNQDSRIAATLQAGRYLIKARTFDPGQFGPYTLQVRPAVSGVPTQIVVLEGDGQRVAPGAAVPVAPAVAVRDEGGAGVAGLTVTFATVPGVGVALNTTAVTDANGVARVGSWTLAAGVNLLSASAPAVGLDGGQVIFTATGKAAAPTAGYDVTLRFANMPTATQLQAFSNAAARWESVITGDLPEQPISPEIAAGCGAAWLADRVVDDVIIDVRLENIDGPGQVLGSAGPCAIRQAGLLPASGRMRFDTSDLDGLIAGGNFENVILHEMGHVLGIGTIWSDKGLLASLSTSTTQNDTRFTGSAAIAAFDALGGGTYAGAKVPVENTGGAGTINSHWRESVLRNELMTGFLNSGSNPLSLLTIASLADLGYTVNALQADGFTITALMAGLQAAPDGRGVAMRDDVWHGPRIPVDARGRPVSGRWGKARK